MFGKLKDKLKGVQQSLGKIIEKKAVAIEETTEIHAEEFAEESAKESEIHITRYDQVNIADMGQVTEPINVVKIPGVSKSKGQSDKIASNDSNNSNNSNNIITKHATGETQPKPNLINGKVSIFNKIKTLVLEREVYLDEGDLADSLWELELALLESDVALSVVEEILESIKTELVGSTKRITGNTTKLVEDALRNALLKAVNIAPFDFDAFIKNGDKPITIMFIGVNGTGKTTTIAKMAQMLKVQGYSVVIAAGDTFRAGAITQIEVHANRLGIKLVKHQEGSDPAAVIYDAIKHAGATHKDIVLADTAGRFHTSKNLMEQLRKINRINKPDLVIFVDEATAGNDAVERAIQFNEIVPISGSILTKTDMDSKGGAAISIAHSTGKPILFLGFGQDYTDLKKFDGQWFVDQLFE